MALKDFVLKQFVDVIDWVEDEPEVLAWRFPMRDREIQNGAMLTVRETQRALFVNEGRAADVFGPGLHRLETRTLPVLTNLLNWDKLFASPFKSDVYFFSTREQLARLWGTATPVMIRDAEFGPIRLRSHGSYSWRIQDAGRFFSRLSGTLPVYSVDDIDGQLRAVVLTELATALGASRRGIVDMAASQSEFSRLLLGAIAPGLAAWGVELTSFQVQSISLPEELQTHFDRAASMRMLGDLGSYARFQAADSLPAAAANPGGLAAAGAALGAGAAMAQTLSGAMSAAAPVPAAGSADPLATLERLHALVAKGVLSQAEFETKKAELLGLIR